MAGANHARLERWLENAQPVSSQGVTEAVGPPHSKSPPHSTSSLLRGCVNSSAHLAAGTNALQNRLAKCLQPDKVERLAWWRELTRLSANEPVVLTALDAAYAAFLQHWQSRMARFGLRQAVVVAFDAGVVRRPGTRATNPSISVVEQATNLRMSVLRYAHTLDFARPGMDGLGREIGEKDIVVWRTVALLLAFLGEHGRVLFSEMDVYWALSPMPLLDTLARHNVSDRLLCAKNRRAARSPQCNIGMLAMRGSSVDALARALSCAADAWLLDGGRLGSHGQAAFNALARRKLCGLDFAGDAPRVDEATGSRAVVQMLPPAEHANNQPSAPRDNPSWGPIERGVTASVHLTAMCFVKGCGAEPDGAKLTVLRALYAGRWPRGGFRLANVHKPMVQLLRPNMGPPVAPHKQLTEAQYQHLVKAQPTQTTKQREIWVTTSIAELRHAGTDATCTRERTRGIKLSKMTFSADTENGLAASRALETNSSTVFENASSTSSSESVAPTRRVWDLIAFGFEVDMLTLHMRVLQDVVAGFIITESDVAFQTQHSKPLVLTESLQQGRIAPSLARMITLRPMLRAEAVAEMNRIGNDTGCEKGGWKTNTTIMSPRCLESIQRNALFEVTMQRL
jgi:hypothetical protein